MYFLNNWRWDSSCVEFCPVTHKRKKLWFNVVERGGQKNVYMRPRSDRNEIITIMVSHQWLITTKVTHPSITLFVQKIGYYSRNFRVGIVFHARLDFCVIFCSLYLLWISFSKICMQTFAGSGVLGPLHMYLDIFENASTSIVFESFSAVHTKTLNNESTIVSLTEHALCQW